MIYFQSIEIDFIVIFIDVKLSCQTNGNNTPYTLEMEKGGRWIDNKLAIFITY